LEIEDGALITDLAAGISPSGRLDVLYISESHDPITVETRGTLYHVDRALDLPGTIATTLPTVSPLPTVVPTATLEPTPSPSPMPQLNNPSGTDSGLSPLADQGGLVIGVGLAVLIIAVVFGKLIAIRRNA